MKYSIKQLAQLSGVSVRTLHYYDQIGLLRPQRIRENGYRSYGDKELSRLQQILFFRELEFSLDKIKQIMNNPAYQPVRALKDQQKLLELKKTHLENLITVIKQTINSMKGGDLMSNQDKYSAFSDPTYQQHKQEVEERWGNTEAYKQSQERLSKMSRADLQRIKQEAGEITNNIARAMQSGRAANSQEVQKEIERFYQHLRHFYEPSYQMFKGLGQMYVEDPRFNKTYEDIAPGMATFMRDAMIIFADSKLS